MGEPLPLGTALLGPASVRLAHAVLKGQGYVVTLATEKVCFDDAKLELPGAAIVPPPVHLSHRRALVGPFSQSFTVDFARPNSCCSTVMVAPSAHLSAKHRLNTAE